MRVQKNFALPSRTKQAFKDECDINKIIQRFKKVAGEDCVNKLNAYAGGSYGDFSQVVDYRSALDVLHEAEAMFGALPAVVRKRFGNDAAEFLDFCHNPANKDELVKLGLARESHTQNEQSPPVLAK